MKDYSNYSYMELYGMLNHINPYEFQDKITEIRKEIELRKDRGEHLDIRITIDLIFLKLRENRKLKLHQIHHLEEIQQNIILRNFFLVHFLPVICYGFYIYVQLKGL